MTGKDVLPEKDLLEKAATMKRFEYSSCVKELKKQISVAEKQYQSFDNVLNHDEKEKEPVKIKKEEPLTINESSLFYNSKYTFSEFKNVAKYEDKSLKPRYKSLTLFKQRLKEFKRFTPKTVKTRMKKKIV